MFECKKAMDRCPIGLNARVSEGDELVFNRFMLIQCQGNVLKPTGSCPLGVRLWEAFVAAFRDIDAGFPEFLLATSLAVCVEFVMPPSNPR